MRVLVTGANGFVGRYVVQALVRRGHEVFAGVRELSDLFHDQTVLFDLNQQQLLDKTISKIKPDGIIHLAAQSMVSESWAYPSNTLKANTIGTLNLLEAVKYYVPHAKILTIGSSEEYGLTAKSGEPLTEEHPCDPQNPYATSKLAVSQLALQLSRKDHLNIVHVRPFNHFGAGQKQGFVISDFCSQIARIENGQEEPIIRVGNLEAKRDFTDVRDVVNAYLLLLDNQVDSGIYNVCSGNPRQIQEILDMLIAMSKVKIEIQIDKDRLRPADVPLFFGSAEKIQEAVGWHVQRAFEDSLMETLEWWRNKSSD